MHTLAQLTIDNYPPIPYPTGFRFTTVASVISGPNGIIKYLFVLTGIALLVIILGAGFTLLTSAGDVKAIEKGKKSLTYGIVGFIIIIIAYWLVQLTGIMFGIKEIQTIF